MSLSHWLERLQANRKQRDKERAEKVVKGGMNSDAGVGEDRSHQATALVVSSKGLLPSW